MTAGRSDGLLAIFNDADPVHEAEYHRWYWEQHLPERLSVPGFIEVCRYRAVEATPRYFTWYGVRDVEVLRSPKYLERLANPTEWTRNVMPWVRNMTRCACRVRVDVGRGIGSVAVVMRASAEPQRTQALGKRVAEIISLDLVAPPSELIRVQLCETDRAISDQRTPEQVLRGGPDRMVDHIVIAHTSSLEEGRAALARIQDVSRPLTEAGEMIGPHLYTLMHCLSAGAA
jgi:hypothetical protein